MMVNFQEIAQIAMLVSEFDQTLIINNFIVDEWTFGEFVSNTYDA